MIVNTSSGSGAPDVVDTPCPDGISIVLLGGVFGGLIGLALYAWSDLQVGPRLLVLAWPALFLSLGWNLAELGSVRVKIFEAGVSGIH